MEIFSSYEATLSPAAAALFAEGEQVGGFAAGAAAGLNADGGKTAGFGAFVGAEAQGANGARASLTGGGGAAGEGDLLGGYLGPVADGSGFGTTARQDKSANNKLSQGGGQGSSGALTIGAADDAQASLTSASLNAEGAGTAAAGTDLGGSGAGSDGAGALAADGLDSWRRAWQESGRIWPQLDGVEAGRAVISHMAQIAREAGDENLLFSQSERLLRLAALELFGLPQKAEGLEAQQLLDQAITVDRSVDPLRQALAANPRQNGGGRAVSPEERIKKEIFQVGRAGLFY